MALFFLGFFLIYGGLHLYFFLKIRAAFAPGAPAQALLVTLLLLGLLAPVVVRAAERYGFELVARLFAWTGYVWMALVMLFFSVSLLMEIYRLFVHLGGWALRSDVVPLLPSARNLFLMPVLAALGIVLYGSFEARSIRTENLVIRSVKIPKETGRIRIVQISDLHVGVLIRGSYLAEILKKVRETEPDLLLSTGDLVDGQGNDLAESAAQFREIRPRYGKFAVTGNHEFYAGIDQAIAFTQNSGFVPLRGRVATVAGVVDLVGVDDPGIHGVGFQPPPSDREALAQAGGGRYTILLKHQPLVDKSSIGAFDLQLSGHTHRGQIFPFSLVTRLAFPYHAGDYRLADGVLLHVSRGTGTWGPPIRFLSPPEITVIDLLPG